jgi:hypothetical protein
LKRAAVLAGLAAALVLLAPLGAQTKGPAPAAAAPQVPGPVAISRVRFDVRQGRALVTTDLTVASGRAPDQELLVHVGYGAPGMPLAFEAQLLSTPKGYLVAPLTERGERLPHARAARAPSNAALCLGRPELAGSLVTLPAALLAQKLAATGHATVRLREVRELPAPLSDGTRELLARLASSRGRPLVLGLIELASDESIARVDARYCGLERRPARLFVAAQGNPQGALAPPLAPRAPGDDLCLRFGPAAPAPSNVTAAR